MTGRGSTPAETPAPSLGEEDTVEVCLVTTLSEWHFKQRMYEASTDELSMGASYPTLAMCKTPRDESMIR